MNVYTINGGNRLYGEIEAQGAKNSALPILAACVLADGESVVENCPRLSDVDNTVEILRGLGCKCERSGSEVTVDASGVCTSAVPDELMREMRSSVIFLGAVLARTGEAEICSPGGCEIGRRPIDLHISALRSMGAEIVRDGDRMLFRAAKLKGCDISLAFPSVGATENIMLAATAAEGITRIHNPAREPEICDLQAFLRAMGARVSGAGGLTIEIEGGHKLHGVRHRVLPDRIATVTYLAAAAAAGGAVTVSGARPYQFSAVSAALREAGCEITERSGRVTLVRHRPLRAIGPVRTMPYPGFPTDAQSILMSVLASAEGSTIFVENIFENRFRHAGELEKMGADIYVEGRVAVVTGVKRLRGAPVVATDLRGGAGLAVAALGAEGRTRIEDAGHIARGYEQLDVALRTLGADVTVTEQ